MCDVSVRAGPARRFGFLFAVALAAPVALVAQGGVVAGATLRTLTDAGGRFRLTDVPGARVVLQVRVIGFRSAEDTVAVGDLEARIVLDQKALELNQVVVTGTPAATTTRALGNAVSHID